MAIVVEITGCRIPFIVASPTMRIPGILNGGANAYLSMRAALIAVLRHNSSSSRGFGPWPCPDFAPASEAIHLRDEWHFQAAITVVQHPHAVSTRTLIDTDLATVRPLFRTAFAFVEME